MNKKLIIAIVAGIVALALIVTAAVVIIGNLDINKPEEDNSSLTSSVSSDKTDDTGSNGNSDSTVPTVEEGSVSIGTVEAEKGEVIDVPIKLSDNPGILAGKFVFEYDATALEYVDYEKGDIFDEYDVNKTNGKVSFIIMAAGLEDVTDNGTVVTLQFKVKDGAPKGDYVIKFSSESEMANSNEQQVIANITDGKITVK